MLGPIVTPVDLQAVADGRSWGLSVIKRANLHNSGEGRTILDTVVPIVAGRCYFNTFTYVYVLSPTYAEARLCTASNADGTGEITPLGPLIQACSPALGGCCPPVIIHETPPLVFRYNEDTAKALVIHLHTGNDNAMLSFYTKGWWKED